MEINGGDEQDASPWWTIILDDLRPLIRALMCPTAAVAMQRTCKKESRAWPRRSLLPAAWSPTIRPPFTRPMLAALRELNAHGFVDDWPAPTPPYVFYYNAVLMASWKWYNPAYAHETIGIWDDSCCEYTFKAVWRTTPLQFDSPVEETEQVRRPINFDVAFDGPADWFYVPDGLLDVVDDRPWETLKWHRPVKATVHPPPGRTLPCLTWTAEYDHNGYDVGDTLVYWTLADLLTAQPTFFVNPYTTDLRGRRRFETQQPYADSATLVMY
jgi:hypothetical protein